MLCSPTVNIDRLKHYHEAGTSRPAPSCSGHGLGPEARGLAGSGAAAQQQGDVGHDVIARTVVLPHVGGRRVPVDGEAGPLSGQHQQSTRAGDEAAAPSRPTAQGECTARLCAASARQLLLLAGRTTAADLGALAGTVLPAVGAWVL